MFPSDPNYPTDPNNATEGSQPEQPAATPSYPPADDPFNPSATNPYSQQQQQYPTNTPLGGAPNSQQNNPYAQPQPNPYSQPQSNNTYGQQNPYQPNNTNQSWPPTPGQQFYGQQYGSYPVPVDATKILTYGILSIFCFGIFLGPYAMYLSGKALAAIDSGQADPSLRGKVMGGRICALIATTLWAIKIIAVVVAMLAGPHTS